MIEAWAPGKLFIAGEYAVVDAGEPAVLVAVNRGIRVRLTELRDPRPLHSSEHVLAACRIMERFRESKSLTARHYDLQIDSDLEDQRGRKFGLGSSAAVTVAVITALNQLYDLDLDNFTRFQLALLATIDVAPKASGGDLAASTFGGWVHYTSPDRETLRSILHTHDPAELLRSTAWSGCSVTQLRAPTEVSLLVGWTGIPASTEHLVDEVRSTRTASPGEHTEFVTQSRHCVTQLAIELERGGAGAPPVILELRRLLQDLGRSSETEIETARLRALCEIAERHGAAGKPSGAGGGDCGIVLAGSNSDVEAILHEWSEHDIVDLDLAVHPGEGVFDEH